MIASPTEALDPRAASLISRLAQAHVEGIRIARTVWTTSEAMDRAELAASAAIERAANYPWDEAAADRAVFASSVYEELAERESRATVEWAAHRLRVAELLDEADAVVGAAGAVSPSRCAAGVPRQAPRA